jgi:hypoxanthine-guanine phosphoribosyltransferase
MYRFDYIVDYYPESKLDATEDQIRDRQMIQDFMFGEPSEELIRQIVSRVKTIVSDEAIDLVCFAPGTTGAKTVLRFDKISEVLDDELDCEVYIDAVSLQFDSDPITHVRYYKCAREKVKGKRVLLVGSVYSTGESLAEVGDLLMESGARGVCGLFVAKTVQQ